MKVTIGSRFNASARLIRRSRARNWAIVLYSVITVIVSALTLVFTFEDLTAKLLGFVSLSSSIILVVVSASLIESDDLIRSDRHHHCASELSKLKRCLDCDQNVNPLLYAGRYNDVIEKYNLNHDDIDYKKYQYEHAWEFEDLKDKTENELKALRAFPGSSGIWVLRLLVASALVEVIVIVISLINGWL